MIEYTFPIFEWLNSGFATWLPDLARVCVWGAISGCLAMLLYVVSSDQKGITNLKSQNRELQQYMLRKDIDQSEYMKLAKGNLAISLKLLRKVGLPSLLASVPVLIFVIWLSVFDTFQIPTEGDTIRIEVVPTTQQDLIFLPPHAFANTGGMLNYVAGAESGPISILDGEKLLYSGEPQNHLVGAIYKRVWWNMILGNVAGYIHKDAPIDEVRWNFQRKTFVAGLPSWISTWEFPFFVSLFIAALALKFGFRIQ